MEIELLEKEIGHVVEIEERVPLFRLSSVIGNDYRRIQEYLTEQGAETADAPYTRYLDLDWKKQVTQGSLANLVDVMFKKWHVQIGMVTSERLEGRDDLHATTFERKKYVKAVHRGPYQKVGETYKAMVAWLNQQQLEADNQSFEFYLNDPSSTPRNELETLVLIALR